MEIFLSDPVQFLISSSRAFTEKDLDRVRSYRTFSEYLGDPTFGSESGIFVLKGDVEKELASCWAQRGYLLVDAYTEVGPVWADVERLFADLRSEFPDVIIERK